MFAPNAFTAEPVRRNTAEGCARNRAQHERGANESNDQWADREIPPQQWKRDPERHNRETVEQSAAACDKPESVMPPGHPRIVERFEDG